MRDDQATVRSGRNVRECVIAQQLALVRRALPQRGRVLEVGCGRGELAAALAGAGYRVTAIDPALPADVLAARGVRFEAVPIEAFASADPFDAIVFTASLHHVERLGPALDRAAELCGAGGVLAVDDFDLRAPDEATALWYFELQELFAVAGLFDPVRIDGKATQPPVARWLAAHAGHHARDHGRASGVIDPDRHLHTGAAMIEAIEARFADVVIEGGPYLFRKIASGLRGPRAPWIAEAIRDAEQQRIDRGLMPAVGLQIIARPRR